MGPKEEIDLSVAAAGSMNAAYQNARARFDWCGVGLKDPPPVNEREIWLMAMIDELGRYHADFIQKRQWWQAIQTRNLLGTLLDEAGSLVEALEGFCGGRKR